MLDTVTIGKIVREERKALGLRQAELAAASGVGVRFLVDLERGKPTVQLGRPPSKQIARSTTTACFSLSKPLKYRVNRAKITMPIALALWERVGVRVPSTRVAGTIITS